MKRLFKKREKVTKGMSSAVVLSILIHAALFLLAGMLVVFTVVKDKEVEFEGRAPEDEAQEAEGEGEENLEAQAHHAHCD